VKRQYRRVMMKIIKIFLIIFILLGRRKIWMRMIRKGMRK